jgi:hypothetical protein
MSELLAREEGSRGDARRSWYDPVSPTKEMAPPGARVLWTLRSWRCEFYPGFGGQGRLEVYVGDVLATAESTPTGEAAEHRAEVLRQRVLRGDLALPAS